MKETNRVILNTRNDLGKTIELQCNRCRNWVLAYTWSISGSGKKCICGNMMYRHLSTGVYFSKEAESEGE